MQPFQWCNGCLCGLSFHRSEHYCSMTSDIYHLPLNIYVIVLGIGLFVFMLSLIFCCYLFRLKQQGTREQFSYNEVRRSDICHSGGTCNTGILKDVINTGRFTVSHTGTLYTTLYR
ncbi:hypothetical protein CHARACLAT_019383 [Characodon lateralis]|uniref:Uncharacterized protein n=1 Tax=Characodon lateralis TaxID=208331 RepID=A0ABU7DLV3_9TELE|nr:hypothetical protein [Characodon lateralis]